MFLEPLLLHPELLEVLLHLVHQVILELPLWLLELPVNLKHLEHLEPPQFLVPLLPILEHPVHQLVLYLEHLLLPLVPLVLLGILKRLVYLVPQ